MPLGMMLHGRPYKGPGDVLYVPRVARDDPHIVLRGLLFAMLATIFTGVLLVGRAFARDHSSLSRALLGDSVLEDPGLSHNVSSCPGTWRPALALRRAAFARTSLCRHHCMISLTRLLITGYTLSSLQETDTGLTAQLNLAGDACNAFGHDVAKLTLQVTYDTETR